MCFEHLHPQNLDTPRSRSVDYSGMDSAQLFDIPELPCVVSGHNYLSVRIGGAWHGGGGTLRSNTDANPVLGVLGLCLWS